MEQVGLEEPDPYDEEDPFGHGLLGVDDIACSSLSPPLSETVLKDLAPRGSIADLTVVELGSFVDKPFSGYSTDDTHFPNSTSIASDFSENQNPSSRSMRILFSWNFGKSLYELLKFSK